MIFIGGISKNSKPLNYSKMMFCKKCKKLSYVNVMMSCMSFSFFFIPIFRWNKDYYLTFDCCDSMFSISKEIGKSIEQRDEDIIITDDDLCCHDNTSEFYYDVSNQDISISCKHCGFQLSQNFTYCPNCGKLL